MNTKARLARRITLVTVVAALLSVLAYGVGWAVRGESLPWDHSTTDAAPRQDRPAPRPSTQEPTPAPSDGGTPSPTQEPSDEPDETDGTPSETPGGTPSRTPRPTPSEKPTPSAGPALLSPGDEGAEVRELQARLKQIAWFSGDVTDHYGDVTTEAVRGFQAKRGIAVTGAVDQRTLDLLHQMTREPTPGELTNQPPPGGGGNTPGPLDARCTTGRVLCIDKSSRTLRWVVDGTVRKTVDVRFGSSEMPTREGVFAIERKSRDHVSSIYHTPMPYAMFFSRGQAVHYSSDFAARGYNGASHGCVNVRDKDAVAWLFDQVAIGDKVVVYWS
ncbi:L,D-transpeptidase family protein [Nocardioides sp. LML1-1-1.1]|uniref:L,D-transpeptidase family protein n=1 Tax=Nocardioides sp. LML1-1-1.1 TaxID=3135248 RepID=UPI0034319DBF